MSVRIRPAKQHRGMTMAETAVVVAVLSVLMGISVPPVNMFLENRRNQLEQADLVKIQDALTLFAKTYNRLPSNDTAENSMCDTTNNTWDECLSLFTSLGPDQIANDVWGNPRAYQHFSRTETMTILPEGMEVHYVTIHSVGADHLAAAADKAGNSIDGIAIDGEDFADENDSDWWNNGGTDDEKMTTFEEMRPGGDDQILKFSDMRVKLEKMVTTKNRLKEIGEALSNYSTLKKQAQVVDNNAEQDRLIYVPRSYESGGSTPVNRIDSNVLTETETYNAGSDTLDNRDTNKAARLRRLESMTALVRMLGLPDEYCCDALAKSADINDDYTQEVPFFYYMNPRPIIDGECKNRNTSVPFMPSTISRVERRDDSAVCN